MPPHLPVPVFASLDGHRSVARLKDRLHHIRSQVRVLRVLADGLGTSRPVLGSILEPMRQLVVELSTQIARLRLELTRWMDRPKLMSEILRTLHEAQDAIAQASTS